MIRHRTVNVWRQLVLTITAVVLLAHGLSCQAADSRYWLAVQHKFADKTGFYLALENTTSSSSPCRLATLRLVLGAANGRKWKFIKDNPGWKLNQDYIVRAIISPTGTQLWLDGNKVGESDVGLLPSSVPLSAFTVPNEANAPTDYRIVQSQVRVSTSGGKRLKLDPVCATPTGIFALFNSPASNTATWNIPAGQTLIIDTAFHIISLPNLRSHSPLIDRYGQLRYANYPEKIHADADLMAAREKEKRMSATWTVPAYYDKYGGLLTTGWHEKATGYYRVVKHNGYWWLITPAGNPCFYRGLDGVPNLTWEMTPVTGRRFMFEWLPPRKGRFAAAWGHDVWHDSDTNYVAFHTCNLIRKYGAHWKALANQVTLRRLRAWGFSGVGKWSSEPNLPSLPVLNRAGVPVLVNHPDIFDPRVRHIFTSVLRAQITPYLHDPMIVGWSLGNESNEIITTKEVSTILAMLQPTPAKRSLIDRAIDSIYGGNIREFETAWDIPNAHNDELYSLKLTPPIADIEQLRQFYADRYYSFIYKTVKSIDPHHLYFGNWILAENGMSDVNWKVIARHCDVIGYDRYASNFSDHRLSKLMHDTNKPVFCGEFSFPPYHHGTRGFGLYSGAHSVNDADAGVDYARWVTTAALDHFCIGVAWFEYRDQPITGDGPGHGPRPTLGAYYAFGLVDVTDTPKWNIIAALRNANLDAPLLRYRASRY